MTSLERILPDQDYADSVSLIRKFVRMLSVLDWRFYQSHNVYHDSEFKTRFERIEALKKRLFDLAFGMSVMSEYNILAMVDNDLISDSEDLEADFAADLDNV
jgi:hypothetical protein